MPKNKSLLGELLLPGSNTLALDPPDFLTDYAREFWQDLVETLGPAGMLAKVDSMALAVLCENLADYWSLRRELQQLPTVNEIKPNKKSRQELIELRIRVVKALQGLDGVLRSWLSEMLLTPASRARATPVLAPPPEQSIDLSELDPDERAALREMLEKRQEQNRRLLQ